MHTLGPWRTWRLAPDSDEQQRHIIVSNNGETEITGIIYNDEDAQLIAAAPDLLEALKNLVKQDLIFDKGGDHYQEVLEAIAKAEGK